MAVHATARAGFEAGAALYARVRPAYPAAAVQACVAAGRRGRVALAPAHAPEPAPAPAPSGLRVLDLAAGTGKLTACLLAHDGVASVAAVEPVDAMRAALAPLREDPRLDVLAGTASAIPLADASVDLVTIAQAFHWFADEPSLREVHRVLRPGAALALVWNIEDDRHEWVRRFRAAYEALDKGIPQYRKGQWPAVFHGAAGSLLFPGGLATSYFDHVLQFPDAGSLWQLVASKSYVASLAAAEQQRVKASVDGVVAAALADGFLRPDAQGAVHLPLRCRVVVTHRPTAE
jgi:SAM-dependent methyltransferase